MKYFSKKEIGELGKIKRANLINSMSGYKSANLIGTISSSGATNLTIFSSVVHIGANPPLLGFIMRPVKEVPRHTYENIKETGVYTINHIHRSFVENAHYTSAKFDHDVSEFAACRLTEEYLKGFDAPFVEESKIKTGLKLVEEISIKSNDMILIIGEIQHLFLPESSLLENGDADLNVAGGVCISGLQTYHEAKEINRFRHARVNEVPAFK